MTGARHSNFKQIRGILIVSVLIIAALLLGYFIASSQDYYKNSGDDFYILWLAPHLLTQEKNPYNSEVWLKAYIESDANWFVGSKYLYPITLAVILIPLGLLPLQTAAVTWIASGIIVILFVSYLVLSIEKKRWRCSDFLPLIVGIFLLRPVFETLRLGQLDWLILLFLVGGLFFWEKQNWMLGGMIFALTALKPQIGAPIIFFLSIWQLLRHKWSGIIGEGIVLVLLYFIGWLFNHSWLWEWLQTGTNKVEENICCTPTLWGFSSMLSGFNLDKGLTLGILLTASLSIFILFILYRIQPEDARFAVGLSIPTALLVSPYLWTYSQIIIVLPILIIVNNLRRKNIPYLIVVTFPLVIGLISAIIVFISIKVGVDTSSSLVPLIIFLILFIVLYRKDRAKGDFLNSTP